MVLSWSRFNSDMKVNDQSVLSLPASFQRFAAAFFRALPQAESIAG